MTPGQCTKAFAKSHLLQLIEMLISKEQDQALVPGRKNLIKHICTHVLREVHTADLATNRARDGTRDEMGHV